MREFSHVWSSAASSGGQTAIQVTGDVCFSQWLFIGSTGVSTATGIVQSGPTSSGPWGTDGFSTDVTSGACVPVRITGPLQWVRPHFNSTGMACYVVGNS